MSRIPFVSLARSLPARVDDWVNPIVVKELRQALITSNPGLAGDQFAVLCQDGNYLQEIRICYTKESTLRRCGFGGGLKDNCQGLKLLLCPVRGAN